MNHLGKDPPRPGRHVVGEPDGHTVLKVFFDTPKRAALTAARDEFDRATRFADALRGLPHIRCPRPFTLITADTVAIRMERCEGVLLSEYLSMIRVTDEEISFLAEQLAQGLLRYVESCAEPYHDFYFGNVLYDNDNRILTLIDFGVPDWSYPDLYRNHQMSPVEVSLGTLIGTSLYELHLPSRFFRYQSANRTLSLLKSLVSTLNAQEQLNVSSWAEVSRVAMSTFRECAKDPRRSRRIWLRSVGYACARVRFKRLMRR